MDESMLLAQLTMMLLRSVAPTTQDSNLAVVILPDSTPLTVGAAEERLAQLVGPPLVFSASVHDHTLTIGISAPDDDALFLIEERAQRFSEALSELNHTGSPDAIVAVRTAWKTTRVPVGVVTRWFRSFRFPAATIGLDDPVMPGTVATLDFGHIPRH